MKQFVDIVRNAAIFRRNDNLACSRPRNGVPTLSHSKAQDALSTVTSSELFKLQMLCVFGQNADVSHLQNSFHTVCLQPMCGGNLK